MPIKLRSPRSGAVARQESAANDDGDPGLPLFSVKSTDPEDRKLHIFRKMFSSSSDAGTRRNGNDADLAKKRSSLVPPNYTPIFTKRQFELVHASPKDEWPQELVSVPDNGILFELQDMYSVFENMEKRPLMLALDDIELFYDWFHTFYLVVEDMFYLEEACLYAWIEKTDQLSDEERKWASPPEKIVGELSEARRLKRKGEILRLGREVRLCRSEFMGRPVLQGLPSLAQKIEPFVNELHSYILLKREHLPACIESRFTAKDRARFEKNYWITARKTEVPAFTVLAATRWMDRRQLRRWKAKWFTGTGKGVYGKWKKTYYKKHYDVVTEFARRVEASETERENQMLMNDMARARACDPTPDEYDDSGSMSVTYTSCASSAQDSAASLVRPPYPPTEIAMS